MIQHSNGQLMAIAYISGGPSTPNISGSVRFYAVPGGTLLIANIRGLPQGTGVCDTPVFGFHVHEGSACTGTDFSDTLGHFNPNGCLHPHHAGDLPPLFGCKGLAYLSVFTDRFSPAQVLGHTVVIHSNADDFTTQPSGNSGKKIACGEIVPARMSNM